MTLNPTLGLDTESVGTKQTLFS